MIQENEIHMFHFVYTFGILSLETVYRDENKNFVRKKNSLECWAWHKKSSFFCVSKYKWRWNSFLLSLCLSILLLGVCSSSYPSRYCKDSPRFSNSRVGRDTFPPSDQKKKRLFKRIQNFWTLYVFLVTSKFTSGRLYNTAHL